MVAPVTSAAVVAVAVVLAMRAVNRPRDLRHAVTVAPKANLVTRHAVPRKATEIVHVTAQALAVDNLIRCAPALTR
jgi:hypothetical protein